MANSRAIVDETISNKEIFMGPLSNDASWPRLEVLLDKILGKLPNGLS